MKKLVIIGANDFQNQVILAAKAMGYETHAFAWKRNDIGERTADYFYPISITEKDEILEVCRGIKPDGVVSIASDLANLTVNYIAEKLGLVCNGIESSILSTNKFLMNEAFHQHGVPAPKSYLVSERDDTTRVSLKYPLIVKPTDRSGSRGITKVCRESELGMAIDGALLHSFERRAIIQEFAEGQEYSVEYISWEGAHYFLACTKKYTTNAPHFIETGHIQPAFDLSEDAQKTIKQIVPRALDALGIKYGASHTEVIVGLDSTVTVVEIGARMGGDCIGSDLVRMSTGYDFCKMVIRVACNEKPDLPPEQSKGIALSKFIFSGRDLDNLEKIKMKYPDTIYRISNIQPFDGRRVQDSSSRYGYYLLSTNSKKEFEEIMSVINA